MFKPTALCGTINIIKSNRADNINNGQRALLKKDTVWTKSSDNKISIQLSGSEIDYMLGNGYAGMSAVGSDSKYITPPSMLLAYLDPPFEEFTVDGITFKKHITDPTVRRNGCGLSKSIGGCNSSDRWRYGTTILHEFGHALGLYHEHQNNIDESNPLVFEQDFIDKNLNPDDIVPSTEPGAICYSGKCYSGYSNSAAFIDNYLTNYGFNDPNFDGTPFDPYSVMLYPLSGSSLKSGSTQSNYYLSTKDSETLAKFYPKDKPIDIEVTFLDSKYQEPWKKYIIKKAVTENFEPITGIKFNFSNIEDGVDKNTGLLIDSDTTTDTTGPITSNPPDNQVGIIVGVIIGVIIFFVFLYLLFKR